MQWEIDSFSKKYLKEITNAAEESDKIILAISLNLGIIFSATWLLILFIFRYSSLASMLSALIVFLYSIILSQTMLSILLFINFVIILYTHRENIVRLKDSKETKIKL